MTDPVKTLLAIALCGFLAGCGTVRPVPSEARLRAETALARGIRAEKKGDTSAAEDFLKQSLTISSSIEDLQLRTTALINLARLYRLQHNMTSAEFSIDRAVAISGNSSPLWAEVAFEKAQLELAQGNVRTALEWAEKSLSAENGNLRGRRLNLSGRIQVMLGDWTAAESLAQKALAENRTSGLTEEEANSLRILGIAAGRQSRLELAATCLQEALRIDKTIGKSSKISADLEELSAAFHAAGKLKESAGYLERAFEVNSAAGRSTSAGRNQETLAVIYTALGDENKAASARKNAIRLLPQAASQRPVNSPATISPSSRP